MSSIPGYSELERAVRGVWNAVSPWLVSDTQPTPGKGIPRSKASSSGWLPARRTQFEMPAAANMQVFIRLAGISGAAAVILGAYGAHVFRKKANPEAQEAFNTANRYHLIHSVVLGLVPLCPHPKITGALLVAGMTVFCGGIYGYAFFQNEKTRMATPFGGILLILAWLSMVF